MTDNIKENNVLITGASGFVGRGLGAAMVKKGWHVKGALRTPKKLSEGIDWAVVRNIDAETDWSEALKGINVVVHLAARVHVMEEDTKNPLAQYRKVNVDGTLNLARQAAAAGVKRFIFISSIKVNGEETKPRRPFKPDDAPAPADPYATSKAEAEKALLQLAKSSGMEVVIIRPPLIYGVGVKANFLSMMRWIKKGVPLPLGSIKKNLRSFVALENLVDLIITCCIHPKAANEIFLVSDGNDLSTVDLLRQMAKAMDKKVRLFPFPLGLLNKFASWAGKKDAAQRLCGTLQVDISKTRTVLDWKPPVTVADAFKQTADHFKATAE